jgi:Rad3-related DNA helicase
MIFASARPPALTTPLPPKASEGIDFADDNARAVVVLSIPFPNLKDTK